MATQEDLATLVSRMSGYDTLNGWDVLLSYDQETVNSALLGRAQKIGLLKPMSWTSSYTDEHEHNSKNVSINLQLWNPVLQFVGTDASMKLTCSISGSYQYDGHESKRIPDRSKLVISSSLCNVKGNCGPNPELDLASSALSNWIVMMDSHCDTTKDISISFSNCIADVTVAPGGKCSSDYVSFTNTIVKESIIEHFQDSRGVQYFLADTDDGSPPTASTSDLLKPTSFRFTVIAEDTTRGTPGTVCMWIGLKGGPGNGMQPSEQRPLRFAPGPSESAVNPIPSGSTASIIFSHYTMVNLLLVPAFHPSKCIQPVSIIGSSGIKLSLNLPSTSVIQAPKTSSYVSFRQFNLGSPSSTIYIPEFSKTSDSISISYSSDAVYISYVQSGGYGHKYGSSEAIFSFRTSAQWQGSPDSSNPYKLDLQISPPGKFSITRAYPPHPNNGWNSDSYSSLAQMMVRPPVPTIDLAPQPLDYSRITDLMFPSQHLFLPDPPVAKGDTLSTGLASPRDTILTGSTKKIQTSAVVGNADNNAAFDPYLPGSINAFKEDLLAAKPILGKLIMTTSSNGDDTGQHIQALLEDAGYGGLTRDDFFALINLPTYKTLPGPDENETGNSEDNTISSMPSTTDPRTFSGIYKVQNPAPETKGPLTIYASTCAIKYGVVTAIAQETPHDTGKTSLWWASEGALYSIAMASQIDPDNHAITASFQGTINDDKPFSGVLMNTEPDESPGCIDILPGSRQAIVDSLISFGFTFPALIGYIGTKCWGHDNPNVAPATNQCIRSSAARLRKALIARARKNIEEAITQNEIDLGEAPEQLNTKIIAEVDEFIKGVDKEQVNSFTTASLDSSPWKDRLADARSVAIAKVRSHVHELATSKVDSDLHIWRDFFDDDTFIDVKKEILEPAVEQQVSKLDASVGEGRGYFTGVIIARLLKAKAKYRTEALARLKEEHDRAREKLEADMRQAEMDGTAAENWAEEAMKKT